MKRRHSRGMFGRILFRSLQRRWMRLLVAGLAILLGALLVAALSTLTLDIGSKVGKELRAYGANLVVSPRPATAAKANAGLDSGDLGSEQFLAESDVAKLADSALAPYLSGHVPYLYGIVQAGGQPVILAGAPIGRIPATSPWWKVDGRWVDASEAEGAMVGSEVARQLGLGLGSALAVEHRGQRRLLTVVGIVDTGAAEDSQIFVNLDVAQELLDRPGAVTLVQVSALAASRPLAETAEAIERALPEAQVKVIGQIAEAEAAVFQKIQLLMALVAALVLLAAALSVASTMTTTVLERTPEIGLLKALGARDGRIALLFLSEAAAIGLGGGALGCLFGLVVAQVIASTVFQTAVAPHWQAVPVTIGLAVAVALVASILPVRRAMGIDPALTLRGE